MEYMPWFAWVVIAGIVVYGVTRSIEALGKSDSVNADYESHESRIKKLEEKVSELSESHKD